MHLDSSIPLLKHLKSLGSDKTCVNGEKPYAILKLSNLSSLISAPKLTQMCLNSDLKSWWDHTTHQTLDLG